MFNIGNSKFAPDKATKACAHAAVLQSVIAKEGCGRILLPF